MPEIKKRTDIVVYVAGPYRADTINGVHENCERAREFAVGWWRQGFTVICPHMNSRFMDGIVSDETFLAGAIQLMLRADIVSMMPGWEESQGAMDEENCALLVGKIVLYDNCGIGEMAGHVDRYPDAGRNTEIMTFIKSELESQKDKLPF